jgi:hypothetical protein
MSGNTRKNQVTRLVTLRHRSTMSGALGLDGAEYQIGMNAEHAAALRGALARYAGHARKAGAAAPQPCTTVPVCYMKASRPAGVNVAEALGEGSAASLVVTQQVQCRHPWLRYDPWLPASKGLP